jgi:hypothetical protein
MRWLLPAYFLVMSFGTVQSAFRDGWIGLDAEIYLRGSWAWLHGFNPWDQFSIIEGAGHFFHYSALPTMVVLGAPFTLVPESLAVVVWIALSAIAAVYVVRRLGLPIGWLAFPPLVEGVLSSNPDIVMLAFLLSGSSIAQAIAPLLKVYAIIPLLGEDRRRALVLAGLGAALTLLALPLWVTYFSDFGARSARLAVEADGGFSGTRDPLLFALGVLAIVSLLRLGDRRAAGWLAVPALWPASQFHYSTLALPVINPLLAVGLASSTHGLPAATIAAYALWRLVRSVREKRERTLDAHRVGSEAGSAAGDRVVR